MYKYSALHLLNVICSEMALDIPIQGQKSADSIDNTVYDVVWTVVAIAVLVLLGNPS